MGAIKGKTSRKLLSEYRRLAKEFWGRHLWGRYFAASSGNVTDEVIMQYIATQDLEECSHDGDFTIALSRLQAAPVSSHRLQAVVIDSKNHD
jgi:putative transposase